LLSKQGDSQNLFACGTDEIQQLQDLRRETLQDRSLSMTKDRALQLLISLRNNLDDAIDVMNTKETRVDG